MLELIDVKKIYKTNAGEVHALDGVSLKFAETGMVFVTGKSGSGKTTLLNVIGGLDGIDGGDIIVHGKRFSTFTRGEYDSYRNTLVGFIFQEYNLLPDYTIEKNVGIANELQGEKTDANVIESLLNSVGIENYKGRFPSQLSGGQKQRVAIARALIKSPKIIMADEPTGALDSVTGIQVLEELKRLSKEKLVIVISHDLELANKYADRIIKMVDGKVVEDFSVYNQEINSNLVESEDEVLVKSGSRLTDSETKTLVNAISDNKKVKFTESLTFRKKVKTDETKIKTVEGQVELIKSKMKLKSSATLGVKSLKIKPLRLIFTILLSAIAFTVFGVFDAVASYTREKVIKDYLINGEYSAVSVNAKEVTSSGDVYDINLSKQVIDDLSSQTGYKFKPVLRVADYVSVTAIKPSFNTEYEIEINNKKLNKPSLGKGYYSPTVTGVVEFSASERDDLGTITEPGYIRVAGHYPVLDPEKPETVYDVAISTYLADSIIKSNSNISSYQDIIDLKFTLYNVTEKEKVQPFNVVGVYNCGQIPEKFDSLKSEYLTKANQPLADELKTYLSSGAHQILFVAEGATKLALEHINKPLSYYSGKTEYEVIDSTGVKSSYAEQIFSDVSVSKDSVIMFSELDKESTEFYNLADGEVIISYSDLKTIFARELKSNIDFDDDGKGEDYKILDKILYDIRFNGSNEKVIREELIKAFDLANKCMKKLNLAPQDPNDKFTYRNITFNKKDGVTSEESSYSLKVVGVYYDLLVNHYDSTIVKPIVMNENTLSNIGVSLNQGVYQRALSLSSVGSKECENLSKKLTQTSGLVFNLYENNVLSVLVESEKQILQFTNLFLYASLALAIFSAFMLFNYISQSINQKRQSIGVLRALGSNSGDVFKMFLTESLIISFISGLIASALSYFACSIVNHYIKDVMNLIVNFAIFGIRQVIVIFAISIITGIVASIIPIIKIAKEKPVELIRRP